MTRIEVLAPADLVEELRTHAQEICHKASITRSLLEEALDRYVLKRSTQTVIIRVWKTFLADMILSMWLHIIHIDVEYG